MDKQVRPLDDYFDAARGEPGVSEQEVRSLVAAAGAPASRRWLVATLGMAGVLAAGYLTLDGSGLFAPSRPTTTASIARNGASTSSVPSVAAGRPTATAADAHAVASTMSTVAASSGAVRVTPQEPSKNDSRAITPHRQAEEPMMKKNLMRNAAVAAALTMGVATNAGAQESAPVKKHERTKIRIEHTASPVVSKMADELGRSAAQYWTARLNSYKTRIDRMLAPNDLEKLNRLRVRFGVMIAENAPDATTSAKGGAINEERTVTFHRNRSERDVVQERAADENEEVTSDEKTTKVKMKVNFDGGAQGMMEVFGLTQEAKGIAGAYRGDFDGLAKDVLADAVTFVQTMKEAGEKFVAENRVEVEKDVDGRELAVHLEKADDIVKALADEESAAMIQMVYSMMLEPLIMLYDGSDLTSFFSQGPLSSAVTGMNLPSTNALKQNTPNPAATTTTISYQLEEPSSATMLRLYDATGGLVGSYDQGAREAGDHAATIDLTKVPNGMYLYHLTVQTPSGERVYSKTMQVAR